MSTVHGVIHTSIVCVYEFRRGFCTSVLSFFQCLLFCGGDAAVTASLALFLDKW